MMYMKYPGYFVHTWDATLETEILATYVRLSVCLFAHAPSPAAARKKKQKN